MGCQGSIELGEQDAYGIVPGGGVQAALPSTGGGAASGTRVAPAPETLQDSPVNMVGPGSPTKSATTQAQSEAQAPFPVPDGWRVVCRLSENDARSRWSSRPRGPGAGQGNSQLEARLEAPAMTKALRLPLSLLPCWTEPALGQKFAGRYEVKRELPTRPWARKGLFEVYDEQEQVRRALEVNFLAREADVKMFVTRLQLESLDTEQRLFIRLRDVALALPGRLGVIEDLPKASLWEELGRCERSQLVNVLAAAASSALDGLARLHANGWVLCSVSPQSVCLGLDCAWKLTGLQFAQEAKQLASASWQGALLPEAILGLPLTEKLDIWLLGASLAEAVMQHKILNGGAADAPRAQKLCRLVEFLGSLPEDLVQYHGEREALFTPEGQMLRPATPDENGIVLEVIEPAEATNLLKGSAVPRPKLLAKALEGLEGAEELLAFLGSLLQPDPEWRPSATQALESQFLRTGPSTPETSHPSPDTKSGKKDDDILPISTPEKTEMQKGALGTPEKLKVKIEASGDMGEAKKGPVNVARKGTGFVQVGDLPDSDEEDEEEEEEEEKPKPQEKKAVQITAEGGEAKAQSTGKPARKGTGFVNMNDLPDSDEEDEEEEVEEKKPNKVSIDPATQANEGAKKQMKATRKGTGFVNVNDLPDSDEDDDEEEEETKKGVRINAAEGTGEQKKQASTARKGTGFVNTADIPSDDESEEEEEDTSKKSGGVTIKDDRPEPDKKKPAVSTARKGTGFVSAGDIPSDDEEEDEEETAAPAKKGVDFSQDAKNNEPKKGTSSAKPARKGTGFVNVNDLPDSDDEDEEEEAAPAKKGVDFSQEAKSNEPKKGASNKPPARKGTGFVNTADLPESDEDEDEEEDAAPAPKKGVDFSQEAKSGETKKAATGAKPARKGTGFVNMNDLPDSDEEDEEEEEAAPAKKGVDFSKDAKENEPKKGASGAKPARKGTGFVNMNDLPDSDEEDEEEEEVAPTAKKGVDFSKDAKENEPKKGASSAKPARKGTGFVNMNDLPDSDDEEEEEEEAAPAKKGVDFSKDAKEKEPKKDASAAKPARKGTGFVNMNDLPDSDEEDEEEEEAAPAKKGVDFSKDAKENEPKKGASGAKPARKGTGFVNMNDLPDSDEEEEEEEEAAPSKKGVDFSKDTKSNEAKKGASSAKPARKGTGFVNMNDLPDSDEEEEEEEEAPKPAKKGVQISQDAKSNEPKKGASSAKPARKGTGFVNMNDLPDSDEEEEEEEEDTSKKGGVTIKDDRPEQEEKKKPAVSTARKGTGFVSAGDIPSDDEDDDEEEEAQSGNKKSVQINAGKTAPEAEKKKDASKQSRKGTGFVNTADLPDSDEEESDEEEKKNIKFDKSVQDNSAKSGAKMAVPRKGTGFVNASDLVDDDDDDDEDD